MGRVPSKGENGPSWKIDPTNIPPEVAHDWLEKNKKRREREEWSPEELPIEAPPGSEMPTDDGRPNKTVVTPGDNVADHGKVDYSV